MTRMQNKVGLALAATLLAASPALAVKDLSGKGALPVSYISVYGSTHTVDNTSIDDLLKSRSGPHGDDAAAAAAVPEPAGWMLMLAGFGLLGAMNRRGNRHPLNDELVL